MAEQTATALPARRSPNAMRRFWRSPRTIFGVAMLALIILSAVFAPLLSTHEPNAQNLRNRLQPPSSEHWLGTDHFGRDTYSRIMYGGRLSISVGFLSVGIALAVGGVMGLLAGFYGGWVDRVMMAISDVLLALPGFLLALAIVAALGSSIVNVMIAVGVATIPYFSRIMRSAVLSVREMDYVAAAEAAGQDHRGIMVRHIVPNALSPVIVQVTLSLAGAILTAAGLSFLGMGAQPPTAEWGAMLNGARDYLREAHYPVTFPGIAIVLTVLALNFVGDGLRDALDPRGLAE